MGYSALAVANYFLANYGNSGIPSLKIQKLVYIAHGWHLAITATGRSTNDAASLVDDEIAEAWKYGPVFPSIHHEFKEFGDGPILRLGTEYLPDEENGDTIEEAPKIEGDELTAQFLDKIWEKYGHWTGMQLSDLCHDVDTPWYKVWKDNKEEIKNAHISNKSIQEHYFDKLKQN